MLFYLFNSKMGPLAFRLSGFFYAFLQQLREVSVQHEGYHSTARYEDMLAAATWTHDKTKKLESAEHSRHSIECSAG